MTNPSETDAILKRTQAGLEAQRAELQPLTLLYLQVGFIFLLIVTACFAETFSMRTALRAQFPELSDGTNLAATMMSMGYVIGIYLLLGHFVLRQACEKFGRWFNRAIDALGLIPILLMMAAMMVFSFSSIGQTTGGDTDGKLAAIAGPALGLICGSLAAVSFIAAHVLVGKFMEGATALVAGRRQRAKVDDAASELNAADAYRAQMLTYRRDIAIKERPGYLQMKAATEAAGIVGRFAAEAHELHASIEARGDVALRPGDVSDVPDIPLPVLTRLRDALAQYTIPHFLNVLKTEA